MSCLRDSLLSVSGIILLPGEKEMSYIGAFPSVSATSRNGSAKKSPFLSGSLLHRRSRAVYFRAAGGGGGLIVTQSESAMIRGPGRMQAENEYLKSKIKTRIISQSLMFPLFTVSELHFDYISIVVLLTDVSHKRNGCQY